MKRRENPYKWLVVILSILIIIYLLGWLKLRTEASTWYKEPTKVRCTCYIDEGTTASGKQTRPGVMAAKQEWIGYTACVNAVNEDGTIGEFIGYYEILDTGYGRETGEGVSKILKDKTLGTIEVGKTVDIWMPTIYQAEEWTSQWGDYVYITLVKGEG